MSPYFRFIGTPEEFEAEVEAGIVARGYPDEPEKSAADRADKALEQGDLSNFALWNRIAKAVAAMLQRKPQPDA